MLPAARARELQAPVRQVAIEPRADRERTFRVWQHLQAERHHSRRGQRNEMAWHDHACVAQRAGVVVRPASLRYGNGMTAPHCVVGGEQADDAAADYEDRLWASHGDEAVRG